MSERAEPDDLGPALDREAGAGEPLQAEHWRPDELLPREPDSWRSDPAAPGPAPEPEAEADPADDAAAEAFARPSIKRTVPAAGAEPLQPVARLRAPVSIFNPVTLTARRPIRLQAATPDAEQWAQRVVREHGVVRLVRVRVEETEAWRVKEEARRAKQRPPKPCAAMRRRKSAKLRKLLGIDLGLDD